jgi:pimeloyl-ACP methyl ester carboxylesterase
MSITISGGGSTAIATDSILKSGRELAALADRAQGWLRALEAASSVAPRVTSASALAASPASASAVVALSDPGRHVFSAVRAVSLVETRSTELCGKLRRAAELYGWAERMAEGAAEQAGAVLGWNLGVAARLIGWLLLGALPGVVIGFGAASLITGSPRKALRGMGAGTKDWVRSHRGLLRNPAVVAFVRQAVSATDDGMLGFAGVPYPLARALDDRATGVFGVHGAAGTVIALAGPRALKETPVTVKNVSVQASVAPPTGFRDLAMRIPPNGAGDPQVRVERYDTGAGRPRWVVYAGGTIDQGFVPDDEPWDDTSNLNGVAEQNAASVRAAHDALRAAGAEPGDAVLPVGYSQGGIVATHLAGQGDYSVQELVTFGSPTGQMDVPATVTDVAVEHRDDIIPALGGEPRSADQGGLNRILVQRTTYDAPPPLDGSPLEAHHIGVYTETAAQMDASTDPRLTEARQTLADFTQGAPADVTMWRADRVGSAASADSVPAG